LLRGDRLPTAGVDLDQIDPEKMNWIELPDEA
jgi:hypothetical protein